MKNIVIKISFFTIIICMSCANATSEKYIQGQLECQQKLADFKWSKQLKSVENITQKSDYYSIKNSHILEKIHDDLLKELVLQNEFNIYITKEMIQKELNRITAETQKPDYLEEIFTLLNHDPKIIANCLVRPLIVDKYLRDKYNWSAIIHNSTKETATSELNRLLSGDLKFLTSANISSFIFTNSESKNEIKLSEFKNQNVLAHEMIVVPNLEELKTKIKQQSNLIETEHGFLYQIITDEDRNFLSVKNMFWPKVSLHKWLESFQHSYSSITINEQMDYVEGNYHLNKISNNPEFKSTSDLDLYGNYWKNNYFVPPGSYSVSVWTGTDMIIWNTGVPEAGGIYNPVTDTWTPTSGIGAPRALTNTVAFWTGDEMLIWGSNTYAESGHYSDGALYNPTTDTWRPISNSGAPNPRIFYSADWTGEELIVWGGVEGTSTYKSTGFRYRLSDDTWSPMSNTNAPTARYKASATWTGTDLVVWGGYEGRPVWEYVNSGAIYNLETDTWRDMSTDNAPSARGLVFDVWTGNELLIWGGGYYGNNSVATGAIYDLQTDTWRPMSNINAPQARVMETTIPVWTGEELIVWGGGGWSLGKSNEGAIYNLLDNDWTEITQDNAPTPRYNYSAVWTGNEMITWGGDGSKSSGGVYNPTSNSWRSILDYNQPGYMSSNSNLFWTGYELIVYQTVPDFPGARYNPTLNYWFEINPQNSPGYRHRFSSLWNGNELLIWGGYVTSGSLNYTGGRYNPIADTWQVISDENAPSRRSNHTAVKMEDKMIIWGGRNSNGPINNGGIYDPVSDSWTLIGDINSPPMSRHFSIWTGNELLLWGHELIGSNLVTTKGYKFDPFSNLWTQMTETNEPSFRSNSSVIWTGSNMIVWGGSSGGTTYNSGYSYHPSSDTWNEISTLGAPDPMYDHEAIWTGTNMIVWSNENSGSYDPESNSWLNIKEHEAWGNIVWADSEMYVWGSANSEGHRLNIYIPHTDYIFINDFEDNQ